MSLHEMKKYLWIPPEGDGNPNPSKYRIKFSWMLPSVLRASSSRCLNFASMSQLRMKQGVFPHRPIKKSSCLYFASVSPFVVTNLWNSPSKWAVSTAVPSLSSLKYSSNKYTNQQTVNIKIQLVVKTWCLYCWFIPTVSCDFLSILGP